MGAPGTNYQIMKRRRDLTQMSTTPEPELTQDLPRTASPANEEFAGTVSNVDDKPPRERGDGWDPYEVWRTRIKVKQEPGSSIT